MNSSHVALILQAHFRMYLFVDRIRLPNSPSNHGSESRLKFHCISLSPKKIFNSFALKVFTLFETTACGMSFLNTQTYDRHKYFINVINARSGTNCR